MKVRRALAVLVCAALLPATALAEELVMFCDGYSSELNRVFQQEHPEVAVNTQWDMGMSGEFDDVLVNLVSRNYVYDLFKFSFSTGRARRLGERKYLADLAQSEVIREAVQQMPAGIRDRVTNDRGEIFAFPYEISAVNGVMGFNGTVAEALGIEKPETWEELFQLFEDWPYDYADEAEKLGLHLAYNAYDLSAERLFARMFNEYVAAYADGRNISFATPEFTGLAQNYARYREVLAGLWDMLDTQEGNADWRNALIITDFPLLMDSGDAARYGDGYEVMPLSVTADPADAIIPMDLNAISVCAGAPHAELAMVYAESLVASMSDRDRIMFQGGSDDTPVVWEYYESTVRENAEIRARIEAEIAEKGESVELREALEEMDVVDADTERYRYDYASESIRRYAALAPCLRTLPTLSFSYYYEEQQNTRFILSQFLEGRSEVQQFVREFEQVQAMMLMEDQ